MRRSAAVVLSCALVAGCAARAPRAAVQRQLDRATTTYEQARTDPFARTYAPFPLHDAAAALRAAGATSNLTRQQHYGYVAEKRAATALAIAEGRRAEQDLVRLGRETADILAQSREREARQARAARIEADATAEAAARALGQARVEMDAMAQRNEDLRRRLDLQALELERARGAAARQARELELSTKALAELKAHHAAQSLIFSPADVFFPTGGAVIAPGGARTIENLALLMHQHPKLVVLIEGHTDSTGDGASNVLLSERRAQAVKQLLVGKGVHPDRVLTKGYGEEYPVASNSSSAGRRQNRRVEVVVLDDAEPGTSASPR
jgi:outer membrane protein OmpA-like peptidoglycan-associated protein